SPLQPLVPPRALRLAGLLGANLGESLVPQLDRRLDLPAADQDGLFAISGRDHCVDAEIDPDGRGGWSRLFHNLADDRDAAVVETDVHQATGRRDALGDQDRQFARFATGQDQATVPVLGRLIREDHLAVSQLLVRVLERLAFLAERFSGVDRLANITDSL